MAGFDVVLYLEIDRPDTIHATSHSHDRCILPVRGDFHRVAAGADDRGVSWEKVIGWTGKGNCNPQHKWNGYDTDEITERAKGVNRGA